MTTREVHEAVRHLFSNYEYPLLNTFIFGWESDFFAISKSGYSVEVEVKVSRADFKKDFTHKTDKHKIFSKHKQFAVCMSMDSKSYTQVWNKELRIWEKTAANTHIWFVKPCESLPNKFFYACPEGLIKPEEVPAYAGLLYTTPFGSTIVKQAPFLHKNKKCFDSILLGKYYHRNFELYQLLCRYKRNNDLTEDQEKQMAQIIDRMH